MAFICRCTTPGVARLCDIPGLRRVKIPYLLPEKDDGKNNAYQPNPKHRSPQPEMFSFLDKIDVQLKGDQGYNQTNQRAKTVHASRPADLLWYVATVCNTAATKPSATPLIRLHNGPNMTVAKTHQLAM